MSHTAHLGLTKETVYYAEQSVRALVKAPVEPPAKIIDASITEFGTINHDGGLL